MKALHTLTVVAVAFTTTCPFAHAQQGPTQEELNTAHRSTEWLLPNHDYAGVRFVDLKEITPANAATLRPVCMFRART